MKSTLFDQKGQQIGDIELNEEIFGVELNEGLVHRALMYQLSNDRIAIAHTKTRGERRGSTRKLYKQKGTGRARMGGNRSPVRRKGGVAFGPRNVINFGVSMNKKERRKALFCVLSSKLKSKELILIDGINFKDIKTKNMVEVMKVLPYKQNSLLAISKKDEVIEKSASNLPYVKSILVDYLNIKDLLKYKTLILLKDSLANLDKLV